MKLEDIHDEWAKDSRIDETAVDHESTKIPQLHAKYLRLLSNERMLMKKLEGEILELKQAKADRLTGVMSKEELDSRGWEPERRRYLKGELDDAISSDKDIINLNLRAALQKEKVEVLDSIVRMVTNRNFILKNIIDWKKFISGVS
jgi:hypothetical protein